MDTETEALLELDKNHVWHPFKQMRDWLKREPIIITEGEGAILRDVHGKEYLDANYPSGRTCTDTITPP